MILVVQSTLTMLVDEEVNLKGSLALHPALHVEDSPQPSRQSACTFFFLFFFVLHGMLMAHPIQASRLQGLHGVNCDALTVNDPRNGTSWQQSKQTRVLLAVMGH